MTAFRHMALPALSALLMAQALPAIAADFVYTPQECEFRITYPEEPSVATACNPDDMKECYETSSFIQVFGVDSSIRISTTCNNAEEGMMERYSGDVMQFTLGTMASQHISDYETGFNDHGVAKQAVLLGHREEEGRGEQIYMAQLWIGKKSVFTVEGHITGSTAPEADHIFSTIFKSIRHVSQDRQGEATDNKEE